MSVGKHDTAGAPVSEDEERQTDSSFVSVPTGQSGNGLVLKRKKPIAAWRLAVMFVWCVIRAP
jgi:hypothetical protein